MNPNFLALFSSNSLALVMKVFELIVVGLFLIYSLLTLRQVSIMNHTLVTPVIGPLVNILAWTQLAVGILVLLVILVR